MQGHFPPAEAIFLQCKSPVDISFLLFYDGGMHKEELIKYLSKKHRRSQRHYQEAITEIFEGISDQLRQGKSIHLLEFGTFSTRMNPNKIMYAGFKPYPHLNQSVRKQVVQKKEQSSDKKQGKKSLLNRLLH